MNADGFGTDAVEKHDAAYNSNEGNHDANSLGTAAAMQALKMFNQRGSDQNQSQGAFVGTALSEASKVKIKQKIYRVSTELTQRC